MSLAVPEAPSWQTRQPNTAIVRWPWPRVPARPRLQPLRARAQVLRPLTGVGSGGEPAPVMECCLRVANVVLLARPRLERQALQSPRVGEADHPRQGLDLAHRVEMGAGREIALAPRQENDARDCGRNRLAQTVQRALRDLVDARAVLGVIAGDD